MQIKRIEHIAIAVRDANKVANILRDTFDLTLEYTQDLPEHETRIAMLPVGQTYVELLEGLAPSAGAAKWVEENSEGLYHICLEVDDILTALSELEEKGVPLINREPIIGHGNWRIAFVAPEATGNVLFELAQSPESWVDMHGEG